MRTLKLVWRIVSGIIAVVLALLLACSLYFIAARAITGNPQPTLMGYSGAVVVSGSMSGSIEIDDMVICRRQESYAPGDVIVFKSGGSVVTHRIVGRTEEGFITKGDANNAADSERVPEENIVGRVVRVVPGIGRLISFLRTPLGMTALVLIGILLLELPALAEWIGKKNTGGRLHGKHERE